MSNTTVGWALCQAVTCPTHTAHAQHHIKVEVHPWARIVPDKCPECGGELKLDITYGRVPEERCPGKPPIETGPAEVVLTEKPAPLPPETSPETLF